MSSPQWIQELLRTHCSDEELKQVESYLHTESWVSPSSRWREWVPDKEDPPLRFHVSIDMRF